MIVKYCIQNKMSLYESIFKTLLEMLSDRHFETKDIQIQKDIEVRKETFNILVKHKVTGSTLQIFYFDDGKIGINHLKSIVNNLNDIKHVLIIHEDIITSFGKQFIISQSDIHFETFLSKELVNNITKHDLVPRHVWLTNDYKEKFIKDFKIKEKNLPRILKSDPIVRYYGCNVGTLIKIYRYDDSINSITYRIVC